MTSNIVVPYPSNDPVDEMDDALAKLRVLRVALMADSQMLASVSTTDAELILADVLDQFGPIREFLAENTMRPGALEMSFLDCRRASLARAGGEK